LASKIHAYTTDGDIRYNGFCFAILEYKSEIGTTGAEPLFQAGWYYTEFMRKKLDVHSRLPCFILYAFGAHIGFAGAVWTDRPLLEVFSPTLPIFYHSTDVNTRMSAARCFGAAKKAILTLESYYKHELHDVGTADRQYLAFPYPTEYVSLGDSTVQSFTYTCHLDKNKLLFKAKIDNNDLCIKFVRCYSKEAHLKCSSLGFAPLLRGFEHVSGGWYMVVMDFIDDSYQELHDSPSKDSFHLEVRQKVIRLHQEGYVHGDIRTTNVMVKKNGDPGIILVDFDWAGVIGEVRYPMNVNIVDVKRPNGAYDNELITLEHDLAMVEIAFE